MIDLVSSGEEGEPDTVEFSCAIENSDEEEDTRGQQEEEDIHYELQQITKRINRDTKRREELHKRLVDLQSAKVRRAAQLPRADWSNSELFPWASQMRTLRTQSFNIDDWRPLQKEVINVTMSKRDCFLIMRSGGGKSLCYQLPALLGQWQRRPTNTSAESLSSCDNAVSAGITLVISPLLSLITDQVIEMNNFKRGSAASITGDTSKVLLLTIQVTKGKVFSSNYCDKVM